MDLDPSQSQGHDEGTQPPPISQLKAARSQGVHFASYPSLSTISDSGSEYEGSDSDSEWALSQVSTPSGSQSSQRSDSTVMSYEETGVTERMSTPVPPPTQQLPVGPQPLRPMRSLRKEDTLMVIDPTQGPSASEVMAAEVMSRLEPRLVTMLAELKADRTSCEVYNFAEYVKTQLGEIIRREMSQMRLEMLQMRTQIEQLRVVR
ncbi:hypothetical protein C8Q76DRAFT_699233 [Earliella scabrosa]|nr:hypothetical protein C8Q76DRAFT_699233 [Earliella scabrosa]